MKFTEQIRKGVTAGLVLAVTLVSSAFDLAQISDVRIFRGDDHTAYRDPAVRFHEGRFHLYFTLSRIEDGLAYNYTAQSESGDLIHWTPPEILTPKDQNLNYSSPGNVVRVGDEWVMCLQTYPTPGMTAERTMWADDRARLFTMRSRDLRHWTQPELLPVKGPEVSREAMGRMIDPYLLADRDVPGRWWCFYKQNGASISCSDDFRTWVPAGRVPAGENVCVLAETNRYVMMHSPANGLGLKVGTDPTHWQDLPGLITLGQSEWIWAKGRLTAGAIVDCRKIAGIGKYLLFFHGSGPKTEIEGDFARNASIGLAWSDDLIDWSWPGK